ncbi:actin-capping protein subunit beta [Seminavis robusta]|uniref:F-actin-capping protein subunit beta n=1 Tax=Seminavis robusta TaxID=568900 RepID=A0A9N8F339_9STRA|nr:actin-capping protein subunit beta [Seminavis robusta]|eukprot:Sro2974_g341280.1 actin-capping protein subunit beta (286) ;mRNA; f:674-1531
MEAALNILRKTPPSELETTLKALESLAGTHDAETIEAVRQRLQLPFGVDDEGEKGEKPFLKCPYNKIKEGVYRSPWTNVCWPGNIALELSEKEEEIRNMEECANEVWEAYAHLYYGMTAIGSVYLQKVDKGTYQGMFGIHKTGSTGSWDSAHLVVVDLPNSDCTECTYHVQSTVVIALHTSASEYADTNKVKISASVSRNTTQTLKINSVFLDSNHLENIGTIIEDVEIDIRSSFERVHIPRTKEMIDSIQKETVNRGTQNMAMHNIMMESDAFKKRKEKAESEE